MSEIEDQRQALLKRVREGSGRMSTVQRGAAFDGGAGLPDAQRALVEKVSSRGGEVREGDVAAALSSGLTEDALFELMVSAALGATAREYESALQALDAAAKGS